MSRDIFLPPGDFGLSPLLSCLPTTADGRQIEGVKGVLVMRFEGIAREVRSGKRHSDAEYAMLRQVLEWLKVDTSQLLEAEG